ncbi:MAG TPA: ABC transporter ATP-binding protein [Candidatus Saccharimonadales bacterium]|nr:ABC transporter ATP-binding protein [Candidatus Saccharimonadales bacterium]
MLRKKSATPATSKSVIALSNLSKLYGVEDATTVALDNLTLKVEKGEFVAIMGPSGCGKTTLMNILGLLDSPTHGEYHLEGKPVIELSQRQRAKFRRNKIGFVFQSFNLLPRVSVIENVALPLTYKGWGYTRRLNAASRLLKTFGLREREYYMPNQLSGGQMQRVAIARALVNNPAIILADEPTGNLDSKSSEIIMQELSEVHKKGHTIIMVTHNPALTVYADRVIQMIDGRVASDSKHKPKAKPKNAKRPLGNVSKRKTTTKKAASK